MRAPRGGRPGPWRDRLAVGLLFAIGIYVVLGLEALGWARFEALGTKLYRILAGFLFLFVANLYLDRARARRRMDELLDAMNMLLYGKSYKRDREAVSILIGGLSSEKEEVRTSAWENLKRLTGQDFALDPEVWRTWWKANEKLFASRSKRPEG